MGEKCLESPRQRRQGLCRRIVRIFEISGWSGDLSERFPDKFRGSGWKSDIWQPISVRLARRLQKQVGGLKVGCFLGVPSFDLGSDFLLPK